jgi:hypothetical protein
MDDSGCARGIDSRGFYSVKALIEVLVWMRTSWRRLRPGRLIPVRIVSILCFLLRKARDLKEKRVEGFYRGMKYSYHLDGPESGFCEKEFIQEHDQNHEHVFG